MSKRRILAMALSAMATSASVHAQPADAPKSWSACAACHAVEGSAALGPSLKGVTGRKAGSLPGFKYSRAMSSSGITWDDKSLADFLASPQKVVPGNRMPFAGISDPREVTELVNYLKTLR